MAAVLSPYYAAIAFGASALLSYLVTLFYIFYNALMNSVKLSWDMWDENAKNLMTYLFILAGLILIIFKLASFKSERVERFFKKNIDLI